MLYKNRIIKIPDHKNIFLFGVRGSGKTAMLKRLYPEALYIDLLDGHQYQAYLSNIGLFYEEVSFSKDSALVIVNEIQRMPQLLNEVHRLIESSKRRFILTASSTRQLKAKGVNFLGGRAGKKHFYPFVPEELEDDFSLDQALRYGLLPMVYSSSDKSNKLKNYVETYLTEEIKNEALVRNFPSFVRFLDIAGLYHGQVVNLSSIAAEAQIKRHLVREFFSILEDTMIGFFLPAYSPKLRVREQKGQKFYFIDSGIARAVKKNFGSVSIEEKGFLFEGLVAQILRTYGDYYNLYDKLSYWSSLGAKQTEVDFILERGKSLIAIEVKAKTQVSSQDYNKGLKAIGELPNVEKRILVYMGKTIRKTEQGIEIWPFEFFCKNLKENFRTPIVDEKNKPESTPNFLTTIEGSYFKPLKYEPSKNKKNQSEEYNTLNWKRNKKKD